MTYRIALPDGGRLSTLDVIDPNSSAVQRFLRREGLAGYEPSTVAALLASFEKAGGGFGFVDVGANIGLYSAVCAAMFEPGAVLALEPTPDIASIARQIAAANDLSIDVQEVAASSEPGMAQLHLADASDVSNSLESGFKASEHSVEVRTMRLDDVIDDAAMTPSVMKIDVEGHEASVLDGARSVLECHRSVVVVEVLNRRSGRLATAISSSIADLGYHAYELAPTPRWESHDGPIAGDQHRDWLLTPEPVDAEFIKAWTTWSERLAKCTPDRNSRLPIVRTTLAAFRRGGVDEVRASFGRFRRSLRRSS